MTTCILLWLGIAATLVKPYFTHQFPLGSRPARVAASSFIAILWPYALFMYARKAYLTYSITEMQINA